MGFNEPTKLQPEIFTFTHSLIPMSNEINNPDKLPKVAIIGAGNLGVAIAKGLATSIGAESIWLCRRHLSKIESMAKDGFKLTKDTTEAVSGANYVFLCVQPHQLPGILDGLKTMLNPQKQVLISTLAGMGSERIQALLPQPFPIVRAMPNTAVAIGESMTCICANNKVSPQAADQVKEWFETVGEVMFIEEEHMKAATVLAASGIAFFLRYIRAATQGGIELGFEAEEALTMATATAKGAASLLMVQGSHPESEIDKVTTPKGCTIAGLNEMEYQGLSSAVIQGLKKSFDKISSIGDS